MTVIEEPLWHLIQFKNFLFFMKLQISMFENFFKIHLKIFKRRYLREGRNSLKRAESKNATPPQTFYMDTPIWVGIGNGYILGSERFLKFMQIFKVEGVNFHFSWKLSMKHFIWCYFRCWFRKSVLFWEKKFLIMKSSKNVFSRQFFWIIDYSTFK